MGTESSIENTPTNDYLNKLLTFDYTDDYHFWYEYLKNSPNRLSKPPPSSDNNNMNELGSEVIPPDARFVYELAERKSKNFENFILTSVKEITDASKAIEIRHNKETDNNESEDANSNNEYDLSDEQNLNALHFALTTLPIALTLLLKDKKFTSSLAFLDSCVFDEVTKVLPEASEFSKRKKKQKKNKKNAKSQSNQAKTAEDEKNDDEEEDKEDDKETEAPIPNSSTQSQRKKKKLSPERQLKRNERLHYLHMRRQRGSIYSLLTESLINLLFKAGLTISINRSASSGDKTGFWSHSSFHVDQIRYDIVHCLVFLSSIIDSSCIYKLKKPVTSYIESFTNQGKDFPLTQFLISITNMEFASSNPHHEPITSRLLQNCISLVISLFQFTSFKENLRSIDSRIFARVFFAPKKPTKSSKDDQKNDNKFERLFGHFLIKSPNKLYVEWISLIFIAFFSNQNFLKKVVHSPSASKEVIEFILSQPVVDQGGSKVSYIHSVILTTLLFILQNAPIPPDIQQELKKEKEKTEGEVTTQNEKIEVTNTNSHPENKEGGSNPKSDKKAEIAKRKKELKLEFKKKFFITYLDDPFAPKSASGGSSDIQLDDDDSCLADFIVNRLLNFCQTETFLPSFICALHLIVPHITDFTLETAINIFNLYEKCQSEVKKQFLDIFATVVQIPKRHSSIKTVILMRTNLFKASALQPTATSSSATATTQQTAQQAARNSKRTVTKRPPQKKSTTSKNKKRKNNDDDDDDDDYDLDDDEYDDYDDDYDDEEEDVDDKNSSKLQSSTSTAANSEQISILHKFISRSKKILLKKVSGSEQKTIDIMRIADVMCRMNIKLKRIFPNRKSFIKHPVTNGAEIEKTWGDWATLICKKTSLQELQSLKMVADAQT